MSKTKWITVAIITLIVFLVLMFGAMMLGMGSYQNVETVWMRDFMPFGGMMMMPMMMFMCLIPIVFIVLIVLGVFRLLQAKDTGETGKTETPLEVLNKRYARGEITKEEFEQVKNDLDDSG